MDVLEKVEHVEDSSSDREELLNRIIAAGLNSLSVVSQGSDKELLDTFVSQSFERILPCWSLLDEKIKFHVFKIHVSDFEDFMRRKVEEGS